jgi:chaperonin GroES
MQTLAESFAARPSKANTSGFTPLDVRVLVRPDVVEEKIGSIFVPKQHKEREQMAQIRATLIAVGANAWAEARTNPAFVAPEPGTRVLIAKYGGIVVEGADGAKYRIMNDEDVTAVIEGER